MATAPWLPTSISSLVGVLVGATLTWIVQRSLAKRTQRSTLVMSTLEELTNARSLVTKRQAQHGTRDHVQPLYAAESATAIWVRFEMLAALERQADDRNALAANGMLAHEALMGGAQTPQDFDHLRGELQRLTVLLLAWDRGRLERGRARGRDFRLSSDEVFRRFGARFTDADLPPVGRNVAGQP